MQHLRPFSGWGGTVRTMSGPAIQPKSPRALPLPRSWAIRRHLTLVGVLVALGVVILLMWSATAAWTSSTRSAAR